MFKPLKLYSMYGSSISIYQTVEDARLVMKNFDLNLGKPLPEKSYGGNCLIYDPGQPENSFHMFWVSIMVLHPCILGK